MKQRQQHNKLATLLAQLRHAFSLSSTEVTLDGITYTLKGDRAIVKRAALTLLGKIPPPRNFA